jgi:TolB-like protein/DNA-binding winged helix-turn-helix (wHTH) protein
MDRLGAILRIGDWRVDPASGEISREGQSVRLDGRSMRLLVCLAEHPGEVVSIDQLLDQVWAGVAVSPDSVYQAVASLRRVLGDDPKRPGYIATVPRLGYRMVATVAPWNDVANTKQSASAPAEPHKLTPRRKVLFALAAGLALCIAVVAGFIARGKITETNRSAAVISVGVLPLLDLTEGMKEGEFADGMTEELIDRLSKVPGLRVPSPTSSFYFKDKQEPVGEIAKALGVSYVLDGSVRKSEARVKIAVRLVRADNGYVVWSESYDRPFDDRLRVQEEIASEVTRALKTSIRNRTDYQRENSFPVQTSVTLPVARS